MKLRTVEWRADLALAGKAAVAVTAAASVYALTWLAVTWAPAVTALDVALAAACLAGGVALFAGGLHLAGVRNPWVGGCYVTALTAGFGLWAGLTEGFARITPATWMGVAAGMAVIYALHRGRPTPADAPGGGPGGRGTAR